VRLCTEHLFRKAKETKFTVWTDTDPGIILKEAQAESAKLQSQKTVTSCLVVYCLPIVHEIRRLHSEFRQ